MAKMDIEDPTHVGLDICKKLKKKWGPLSPDWEDEQKDKLNVKRLVANGINLLGKFVHQNQKCDN